MGAFDYDQQADKYIRQDPALEDPNVKTYECLCGKRFKLPRKEGKQDHVCECGEIWQVVYYGGTWDWRTKRQKERDERKENKK